MRTLCTDVASLRHTGNCSAVVCSHVVCVNVTYLLVVASSVLDVEICYNRKNFIDLFYAIAKGDGKAAGRLMIERVCTCMCNVYVCNDHYYSSDGRSWLLTAVCMLHMLGSDSLNALQGCKLSH
jgi:hypothetical protein